MSFCKRTLNCFLVIILAAENLWAADKTEIRLSQNVRASGCAPVILETVQDAFDLLGAQGGQAHVGYISELKLILAKAGVTQGRAQRISQVLNAFLNSSVPVPSLFYTLGVLKDLIETKMLLACVPSKGCTLSDTDANHLVFVGRGQEAIVILPPDPKSDSTRWVLNFLNTVAGISGERILLSWLRDGYYIQNSGKGSVDEYYKRFASHYDGTFPPTPEALKPGFAIVFMSLYQNLVTQTAFEVIYPQDAKENRLHLARSSYDYLSRSGASAMALPIVRELGITPENGLEKAEAILKAMLVTMSLAERRN